MAALTGEIRLNLEGDWPRAAYLQLCLRDGIEYSEAGRASRRRQPERPPPSQARAWRSRTLGKQWQCIFERTAWQSRPRE